MTYIKTYKGYRKAYKLGTGKIGRDAGKPVERYVEIHSPMVLEELPQYQNLWDHSPSGFNWGYGGSGPHQLALALLYHVTGDAEVASNNAQNFKWDIISNLDMDKDWQMTETKIEDWLDRNKRSVWRASNSSS